MEQHLTEKPMQPMPQPHGAAAEKPSQKPHSAQIGNKEQWEAISYRGPACLVLAGPGSGKTFVLVQHIWYLTRFLHVAPGSVLVLTFSRAAAREMQSRYQKMLQKEKNRQEMSEGVVTFGTFHSVFYHILQNSSPRPWKLIPARTKQALLWKLVRAYGGPESDERDLQELERAISVRKAKGQGSHEAGADKFSTAAADSDMPHANDPGIYTNHTLSGTKKNQERTNAWQEKAFRYYENYLHENGLLDFDDMIVQCADLLQRNPALRARWQKQFSTILIDEFQDISPLQYETIRLLEQPIQEPYDGRTPSSGSFSPAAKHGRSASRVFSRIFCVGDDDQSIYGFRGADPQIMKIFLRDHPEAKVIPLHLNYRSGAQIITAAVRVIEQNENRLPKTQLPGREIAATVAFLPVANEAQEYQAVGKILREERKKGSCAVIFRTHEQARGLVAWLQQEGIPMTGSTFQRVHAQTNPDRQQRFSVTEDIKAYFRLAREWKEGVLIRRDLLRVMNKPNRFLTRNVLAQERIRIADLMWICEKDPILQEGFAALLQDLSVLGRLRASFAYTYLRKSIGYERYLLETAASYGAADHETGVHCNADSTRQRAFLLLLDQIQSLAEHATDVPEFLSLLDAFECKEAAPVKDEAANRNDSCAPCDAVFLVTMHASKGLEYDTVLIPDLNEGILPSRKSNTPAGIEEERRLFYVAMTRARKNLYLLYIRGTQQNPRRPSRFLNCLGIENWEKR